MAATSETNNSNSNSNSNNNIPNISPSSRNESEPLCEGDTKVIYDVLPHPLRDGIFSKVRDEVQWQRMSHQGGEVPRLVAVQGEIGADADGGSTIPIYRHPADESPPLLPFSPAVREIKRAVEARLGHPLNHALIQLYRSGGDYISEHSDKTLDIARDSYIANVSLGAERVMVLRTKRQQPKKKSSSSSGSTAGRRAVNENANTNTNITKDEGTLLKRQVQRARLPHNSLCQMGLATNRHWLHGIRQDRRADRDKSADELAYGGARISLTFRLIGTFLSRRDCGGGGGGGGGSSSDGSGGSGGKEGEEKEEEEEPLLIWGQGATGKTRAEARPVINGATPQAVAMLRAFGRENQLAADFDWEDAYGAGFDVLHISASPRLFLSADAVANMRIQLMLAELGVGYARGSMASAGVSGGGGGGDKTDALLRTSTEDSRVKFVDNDADRTAVQGGAAIMLYLDRVYGRKNKKGSAASANSDADEIPSPPPPPPPPPSSDEKQQSDDKNEAQKESTRFQEAVDLLDRYRAIVLADPSSSPSPDSDSVNPDTRKVSELLEPWTAYAAEADFIAGSSSMMTLADFAFWPVLHSIVTTFGAEVLSESLLKYYERVTGRDSTRRVLAAGTGT